MVIGPIKLMGTGILLLIRLVLKYWWIVLTLVIVMSGLISSINEGIEQGDMRIPIRFLGTSLVSSDEGIYETVQDLEFEPPKKEDLIGKLSYYAEFGFYLAKNLWRNLWMLIFWFFVFFKGERFLMGNDSKSFRAFVFAILTMTGVQILVYGIPFKGIYSLFKFVIEVIVSV